MKNSQQSTEPPLPLDAADESAQAELETTPRTRSWLWPAAAFIGILLVVVVIGRLGQTPGQTIPTQPPGPQPPAVVLPDRSLTPVAQPGGVAVSKLPGYKIGIRSDGDRYDDGIPAILDGNQVVRVRDAAALPSGSTVLVGGWAQMTACGNLSGHCPLVLSDAPFQSSRSIALSLAGQAGFDETAGPHVYQATVQPGSDCSSGSDTCLPELSVGDPLWAGDDLTQAAPITSFALLGDIADRFPNLDFKAFEESGYCPVQWPFQSYIVSSPNVPRAMWINLPIRLVVVYPSAQALDTDGVSDRAAAANMSAFDASNRCVSIPGGVNDNAWVVRDNVMVLTAIDDPGTRTEVRTVLGALAD